MKVLLILSGLCAIQQASAQQHKSTVYEQSQGKITVTQTAVFDTVAAYAEGKVISCTTHLPIAGARVEVIYNSGKAVGVAISAKNGAFQIGWVSVGKIRPIQAVASGFSSVNNREAIIKDGYSNFLLIEMQPLPR